MVFGGEHADRDRRRGRRRHRSTIGDPAKVAQLDAATWSQRCSRESRAKLEDAIDRMKTEAGDVPLIAVGGGAFLVPDRLPGVAR